MNRILSIASLSFLLAVGISRPVWAETVVEKVARTGVLTVGTRMDLVPYSYVNDKGELVGYSIDVIKLVQNELQKELGKDITLQIKAENSFPERLKDLTSGEIDISCDTAFTWQRDQYVDFSVSYGLSGIRLVVPKNSSLSSPESLIGKRIGVLPNTTAEETMRTVQPQAIIVPLQDVQESLTALRQGKVDAIAGDTIVLAGEIARTASHDFALTPVEPYARYGIACMVPENNSSFLDLVNYSLVQMMQSYINGDTAIVNRWFGPEGIVDLPPDLIRGFFQSIILTRQQVPAAASTRPAANPSAPSTAPSTP